MQKPLLRFAASSLAILQSLGSLLLLAERIWIGRVFFKSGLLKVQDWGNTLFLFSDEFKVPVLPPEIAAYGATAVELTSPILLFIGLGSRLATIPMLVMTGVIEFTYTDSPEHFCWAMLLATILCFGPGKISADYLVRSYFQKRLPAFEGKAFP